MNDAVTNDVNMMTPAPAVSGRRLTATPQKDEFALIRLLIWLYLILWLVEGGLRRWVLPGLSTPLLLVRDPLAFLIYFQAGAKKIFPTNGFIFSGAVLAVICFLSAMTVGHGDPLVALYGVRSNFLDVPLIFIMGGVLRREDLLRMAKVAAWLLIPYTVLLTAQYKLPQSAWVNRGVGGCMTGAGFGGALGHFRPPGTFSFITGPATLYPMLTACWFVLVLSRKFSFWLMIASGMAIIIALPISISRSLVLSVVIVAMVGAIAMMIGGRLSASTLLRLLLAGILIAMLSSRLTVFQSGIKTFEARWQNATVAAGGFQKTIVDRVVNNLFGSFDNVGLFGLGTGYSSNVGQKLLKGKAGLGAAEAEWGKLLFDNGLILGSLMVAYRVILTGLIVLAALRAWLRGSPEGIIFASAAFFLVLNGNWTQASIQGAAAIAGGLTLAAAGMNKKLKKQNPSAVAKAFTRQRSRRSEAREVKTEIQNLKPETEEAPFSVTKLERTNSDGPTFVHAPTLETTAPETSTTIEGSAPQGGRKSEDRARS